MHFYYLDESGDTGANLEDKMQPIFVLGGVSVTDEKWNKTKEAITKIYFDYFDGAIPNQFEMHSNELLCRNGEGPFSGHSIDKRLKLVDDVLSLIKTRGHNIHYFAIDKTVLLESQCNCDLPYDYKVPYYSAFDYLITYINWHMKNRLGRTSRGMLVLDKKREFQAGIESIIYNRRFEGANATRIKRIVEFSYSVDSQKNPMVQISDLVVLCIRRFLEIDKGYKENLPDDIKNKYAEWYSIIDSRVVRKSIVERTGRQARDINSFLSNIQCKPRRNWKAIYSVENG